MGVPIVGTMMKKVFGTRNERLVKRYLKIVDLVSERESDVARLSDQQIREKSIEFRKRLEAGGDDATA